MVPVANVVHGSIIDGDWGMGIGMQHIFLTGLRNTQTSLYFFVAGHHWKLEHTTYSINEMFRTLKSRYCTIIRRHIFGTYPLNPRPNLLRLPSIPKCTKALAGRIRIPRLLLPLSRCRETQDPGASSRTEIHTPNGMYLENPINHVMGH